VDLQERDRALFLGLYEAGVMLRSQIADLYFLGSYEAAGKRVQKLLRHQYLRERTIAGRPGRYAPSWLTLTERGCGVLRDEALLPEPSSWNTLRDRLNRSTSTLAHDLGVVDLWVALTKAARTHAGATLKRFSMWPNDFRIALPKPMRGRSLLIPDAFAEVGCNDVGTAVVEYPFFFEWDRSTESRATLRAKAEAYDAFYRSGAFAERCGDSPDDFAEHPFRVVFAVRNEERRNNLLEELARPNASSFISDQFWVATWHDILSDPLGASYLHIEDYAMATAGSLYDPVRYVANGRARARDDLVRARVTKRSLLPAAPEPRTIQYRGKKIVVLRKKLRPIKATTASCSSSDGA
jgi:hypothetical protein